MWNAHSIGNVWHYTITGCLYLLKFWLPWKHNGNNMNNIHGILAWESWVSLESMFTNDFMWRSTTCRCKCLFRCCLMSSVSLKFLNLWTFAFLLVCKLCINLVTLVQSSSWHSGKNPNICWLRNISPQCNVEYLYISVELLIV